MFFVLMIFYENQKNKCFCCCDDYDVLFFLIDIYFFFFDFQFDLYCFVLLEIDFVVGYFYYCEYFQEDNCIFQRGQFFDFVLIVFLKCLKQQSCNGNLYDLVIGLLNEYFVFFGFVV